MTRRVIAEKDYHGFHTFDKGTVVRKNLTTLHMSRFQNWARLFIR